MDKILSTRVDESIIQKIAGLAEQLGTSKKAVVEGAIRLYEEMINQRYSTDVFERTAGAWNREETPGQTVAKARESFRKSMERHLS